MLCDDTNLQDRLSDTAFFPDADRCSHPWGRGEGEGLAEFSRTGGRAWIFRDARRNPDKRRSRGQGHFGDGG
ncbi:hypothetical protein DESC_700105 [Desulfosarcina cetonica]|nr:hypothetical protein DESC_700105 [Desulfosarcina cetonica]